MVSMAVSTKKQRTEEKGEVEEAVLKADREEKEVDEQPILLPHNCRTEEEEEKVSMLSVLAFRETFQTYPNPSGLKQMKKKP